MSGDDENDENTLYVHDEGFAGLFQAEFARQWRDLDQVPNCSDKRLEARVTAKLTIEYSVSRAVLAADSAITC
jgi:phosphatidylserine/phosphatidylglycerophosphate/cardiolipin synthase-like enzyme